MKTSDKMIKTTVILLLLWLFLEEKAYARDVDPCVPDPCENGGYCENTQDGFIECHCLDGYTGTHCEHKVNVATVISTNQSCQSDGHTESDKAIDGKYSDLYDECAKITAQNNPWWQGKLDKHYKISSVVLFNSGDCCQEQLCMVSVFVSETKDGIGQSCGVVTCNGPQNDKFVVQCEPPVDGMFIGVRGTGAQSQFVLCEIKIVGEPTDGRRRRRQMDDTRDEYGQEEIGYINTDDGTEVEGCPDFVDDGLVGDPVTTTFSNNVYNEPSREKTNNVVSEQV